MDVRRFIRFVTVKVKSVWSALQNHWGHRMDPKLNLSISYITTRVLEKINPRGRLCPLVLLHSISARRIRPANGN